MATYSAVSLALVRISSFLTGMSNLRSRSRTVSTVSVESLVRTKNLFPLLALILLMTLVPPSLTGFSFPAVSTPSRSNRKSFFFERSIKGSVTPRDPTGDISFPAALGVQPCRLGSTRAASKQPAPNTKNTRAVDMTGEESPLDKPGQLHVMVTLAGWGKLQQLEYPGWNKGNAKAIAIRASPRTTSHIRLEIFVILRWT